MRAVFAMLALIQFASPIACGEETVTTEAGDWRVVTGPGGNTHYDPPLPPGEAPPEASDAVLHWPRTLTPEAEIAQVSYKGDRVPPEYRITVVQGADEIRFYLRTDGTLTWLDCRNKEHKTQESSDSIVPEGRRYTVRLDQLPETLLKKLNAAYPGITPDNTWFADTLAGPRYIVEIAGTAYVATPGGMIRSGGGVQYGALETVSPDRTLGPGQGLTIEALKAKWGDRFDYPRQIAELQSNPPEGNNFRYVVMGDCRDQRGLLDAMVKHIDNLDPQPKFVIVSGDAVRHGYADQFDNYLLPALAKTKVPYFIAIGNHDVGLGREAAEFRALFGEESLNFYFDYGKSRFVFLDNCSAKTVWSDALTQADVWLSETPEGFRKYVAAHKPPATVKKWAYHAMSMEDSVPFTDLLTKHDVRESYVGHIHAYSTATYGGVDYVLSGGAGAGLHGRFGPRGTVHHYVIVDSTDDGTEHQLVRFYKKGDDSL